MASPGETEPHVLPDPGARRRFEELALPHLKHLYRLAIRLKGSAQDAEDLVQETCVKALRAFSTLRHPGAIRTWLGQILTRLVLDQHRTEPRELAVGDLEALDRFSLYDLVWDEDPFPYSNNLHQDFSLASTTRRCGTRCSDCPRPIGCPSSSCTSRS